MIKDTSRKAYERIRRTGNLDAYHKKIASYVSNRKDATRAEISRATKIPINVICPRIVEMISANVLTEHEARKCRVTGHSAHPVSI